MEPINAGHTGLNKQSGPRINYFVPAYSPPVPGGGGPVKWTGLSDHPANVVITDEHFFEREATKYPSAPSDTQPEAQ